MTRDEILAAAQKCVSGDRDQDYGKPERSFKTIAALWNAYLIGDFLEEVVPEDVLIRPKDVAAMLALLKIARIAGDHAKADSWIDLAGYAACGGEIETEGMLGFEDLV